MKKYIVILVCIFLNTTKVFSQLLEPTIANKIQAIKEVKNTNPIEIDTNRIFKIEKYTITSFEKPIVHIKNVVTTPVVCSDSKISSKIPETIEPQVLLGVERKKNMCYIFVPQYIKSATGQISKINSYEIELEQKNTTSNKTLGTRVYATNSVLANGSFYCIGITEQGVYKIDASFIQNTLGVNLSTLNTANIRLYGNGGEMLPEDNKISRADDLIENAIQVVDGGDGQLNNGDYILFYANGPHTIVKDSINKRFEHKFNVYSEQSYYFLNFDKGAGKRITLVNTPSTNNVNVTGFNDYQYYERDSASLGQVGRMWFADDFSTEPGRSLTHDYSFTFPNIEPVTPIHITTQIAGKSEGSPSVLKIKANGIDVYQNVISHFIGAYSVGNLNKNSGTVSVSTPLININASFTQATSNSKCNMDYIGINARRKLVFNGYLNVADWNSVGAGNIAEYEITNANSSTVVWDITNPLEIQKIGAQLNATTLTYKQDASMLHRFIVFDGSVTKAPKYIGAVKNQNLHNLTNIDYVIITNDAFKPAALQLAVHHKNKRNYTTAVVTTQEIYNEFNSGSQDVSAIRDFIKMLYDKSTTNIVRNVLFFGDASYDVKDRVKSNTNFAITYETEESLDKNDGYCSDDFFGYLDDNENINDYTMYNILDIGVGRLPVNSLNEAYDVVTKIENYDSPKSFGPWKNTMTFNADNGDNNLHLNDAESVAIQTTANLPLYNVYKIYVDGFNILSTPGGSRVPDANVIINNQIYNGTFVMNYNGHGGTLGWCDERILSIDDINNMKNDLKLPLYITATCDFAQYDNPAGRSAGEVLMIKPNGGAIALMTTTQLVYSDPNKDLNLNYFAKGFSKQTNGLMPTLGDAYKESKNIEYSTNNNFFRTGNFRKFALLGDPGLPLAFPKYNVVTDSINGISITTYTDTLKALGKYTLKGSVRNNGIVQDNFNGVVYISIFDKFKKLSTLGNNAESPKKDYLLQNNIIFKGKATVKNGTFTCTFILPKDINYEVEYGKISYYANSETDDASGFDKQIKIGSSATNIQTDNKGPEIKPYLNNDKFVNGGITTPNSILLVKLFDEQGINTSGTSVGHDITAVLDNNTQKTYVLNNYYEGEVDDYQRGVVHFPINNISEGEHTLKIKAWDINNNSSEAQLNFVVVNNANATLAHVYNYPNPFSTHTQFMFEHNMPNEVLYAYITIYSVSGKVVKQIQQTIHTDGTRYCGMDWDGKDAMGDKLGQGVYIYKLHVKSASGKQDTQYQKLMLIR